MSDELGPGYGSLVGLAWGAVLSSNEIEKERSRLLREAREKGDAAVAQSIQKDAVRAVANALIDELKAGGERRLSDPDNVHARAEDFIDSADGALNRLSGGRLSFSRKSVDSVKNAGMEIKDYFDRSVMQPQIGVSSRPKK